MKPRTGSFVTASFKAILGTLLLLGILLVSSTTTPATASSSSAGLTGPPGTEYVSFWSGDLRIIAHSDNTEVALIDVDTGALLSMSDPRIKSTNFSTNPFILSSAGDSFEGVGGKGGMNDEIRVRISAIDSTSSGDAKLLTVWTGWLKKASKHPSSPIRGGNAWMSYVPATPTGPTSHISEVGKEFMGFTTREMYIVAKKSATATSIQVDDLITNTDSDGDDTTTLTAADAMYSNSEIEVYFLNGFEDDTFKVTSNVDASVLVGKSASAKDDWSATPPSFAPGDEGMELGRLFYAFVHRSLTIFPTQDDTTVAITDLSDGDDTQVVTLTNGDAVGDYDLYTSTIASLSSGNIVPRTASPAVTITTGVNGPFEDDIVKITSDKPVLVYVGPVGSQTREFADVAFSVPTGPDSRIIYAYAQASGGSNDLQVFGFDPDTTVNITSLSFTDGFRNTGHHDFEIGPGLSTSPPLPPAQPWLEGTAGSDVWWGSGAWNAEILRIESDKPITVINGDIDSRYFGAFVPFLQITATMPPLASAGPPQLVCLGQPVVFDGSGSFDQDTVPGNQTETYAWDFDVTVDSSGDGITDNDIDGTGASPSHTYGSAGIFTAKLTFTDDDGESDTDFVEVTVEVCQVTSPKELKEGVVQQLTPHINEKDAVELVIGLVNQSLEPQNWIDDFRVVDTAGDAVFGNEQQAVRELLEMLDANVGNISPELVDWANMSIDDLVEADRILADTKIQDVLAGPTNTEIELLLAEAQQKYNDGLSAQSSGDPVLAIQNFWDAWDLACQAMSLQNPQPA